MLTIDFQQHIEQAKNMNHMILAAVQKKYNERYVGILYGSFIATQEGIKLIEFNARFGDPEALNLLALLESDFVSICEEMMDAL
ncbi:MAG: hypothetical protein PSV35_05105 [bacterium]|nr:hypothetical protein [bacterium]